MAHVSFSPSTPLGDALVILGAAGIVIPVFARFRITPVIGFILVGLLVGPYGLGRHVAEVPWLAFVTITNAQALAPFAEFGIILLLFSVGLELSFDRLWAMRKQVLGLGAAELLLAALALGVGLKLMGQSAAGAVGLGLALSMSSTALVLPIAGSTTPVGRAALAMLLFEDLALVPIIFLLGALAPRAEGAGWMELAQTLGYGALVVAVLMVFGRYMLPHLFAQAARTKSPELFLSASLLVVIVAALATAGVGLSPIVGALIAGLLIAETEYHTEVEGITAPFKGLALGVFLITVGMSIDLAAVAQNWVMIIAATTGVVVIKAAVTAGILRLTGARRGVATEAGILMSSPSETTLIVLATASGASLIAPSTAQFWQTVTALGLTVTPLLAWAGRRLARRVDAASHQAQDLGEESAPHAVIIGFGRVGQLVADMLNAHHKPYMGIDSDPDLIAGAVRQGYRATFGEASSSHMLERLGLDRANCVILTMDEPRTAQRLVKKLRAQYPDLPILARARDTIHAAAMYRAGATHAIPETLEATLQLSEAVLVELGVPMGFVIASIHEKRDEYRETIMHDGGLSEKPKLKSSSLRERVG
ncbi:MAG: sodium:proton exchanger [Novosphingobium sp. 63-713]|uniref:cation:proton antiporter domain-containing protein n=1 Tax=unclassified Novosphingobium TaxID=2644732 RepID=UPI00095A17D2|nr:MULTISPECIES: cation:proton antiporter [unclassified Novosphingobium]MBN9144189.1 cation:proton antiporter [Novosphingobium sp.]MDR6708478.1 CPA2 family monovalent cation:H+ antiporter-2 [Novosphingobium sp. 1748]OJX94998.1 MAG: sodium:proton exchanger [Novosphingobium sp. 63-713]